VAKLPSLALPSKHDLALAKAKFGAWWNGKEFDPASVAAADGADSAADDLLFDGEDIAATDPRLVGLQRYWGDGRLMPGDAAAEALLPVQVGLSASGVLGVFGPGLAAPVAAMAVGHPGPIRVFEWRDGAVQALAAGFARSGLAGRTKAQAFDLETSPLDAESLDGAVCFDAFTYCGHPGRLALQLAKALKPGGGAVLETYCGAPGPHLAPAFASAFLEPQVMTAEALGALLFEAGLRIETDQDVTAEHLDLAKDGLRRRAETLGQGKSISALALREIAWEAETWQARKPMLAAGALSRRQIHVIKR
jgi:SAM-dependent methyltransferase